MNTIARPSSLKPATCSTGDIRVVSRSFLGDGSYTTYPHMNAYGADGRTFVYARTHDGVTRLYQRDLHSGSDTVLFESDGRLRGCWEAAWREGHRLVLIQSDRALVMDGSRPGAIDEVYTPSNGGELDLLGSLSSDGQRVLLREKRDNLNRALELHLESGKVRELFAKDWYANHFHYCPHDENWVGFSHEGKTELIPDRCWVWHAEHAPDGRVVFDQASDTPGKHLCVGHERWCFHDVSAYAIAYAVSPAGKRGLYEVFGDGRPARLLWHSDVLWHCTMDITGRYVAADTTGPLHLEPFSDAEYQYHTDRWRRLDVVKEPAVVGVVLLDLQRRQFLHLAEAWTQRHPYHPHPAISPNARWVAWNDWNPERRGVWLAEIAYD